MPRPIANAKPLGCSFTEEFLQAVSAAQDAANLEPPVPAALDPRTIEAQPEAFQILWDRFTDEHNEGPPTYKSSYK